MARAQMVQKGLIRPSEGSIALPDDANGPRGAPIGKRAETASCSLLNGHCRHDRNARSGANHAENAAELAAFEDNFGIQARAFAGR